MKSLLYSIVLFLLTFSFTLLLQSCSNESTITSPSIDKSTVLAKTVVVPTSKIDHSTDTVITFPKSKKTLCVSKSYTSKMLAQIDDYLATHTVPIVKSFIKPNSLPCNQHDTFDWILEQSYEPAYQKNLGIWCDYLTPAQCYNYGFNEYFLQSVNSIQTALNAGYSTSNIMYGLSGNYTNDSTFLYGNPPYLGYYYIDEPAERGTYTQTQLENLGTALASKWTTSKLCMGSYDWVQKGFYLPIIQYLSNSQMMCDQYHGDFWGTASAYWGFFQGYYGSHSTMNWMDIVANDMNCDAHDPYTGLCSDNWAVLLLEANNLNENNVWLYAYENGNESAVQTFSLVAWQYGWMYRYQATFETIWQCDEPNPCTNCVWGNGDWYIVQANIFWNGQWVTY